jgi:prepilin-type N-terminal cleavage/methylation domain-containing protein
MKHSRAGYSLIELLVAMSIFAVVATAIAAQMVHSTAMISQNAEASQAITIAQQVMEDIRTLAYSDMSSGSETVTWKGQPFDAVWHVSEDEPEPGTKTVVVTVSWENKGETKTYETRSVYSQIQA